MLYRKSYGAGQPLYLLHGWALNSRVWDPVIDQLQQNWRVVTVDLPGHGKSPPPAAGQYDIDILSEQVCSVIDTPAVLVGWSLGGMVALNIAARHPDLVNKLALVASSPQFVASSDWSCGVKQTVLDGFADELAKDYRATILRFLALQTLGSEQAKQAVRELREKVFINGEPHIESLAKGLKILSESNLRERMTQISCPILQVLGEKDTLIPACCGEQTQSLVANGKLSIIKGAGHAPFISHSTEFLNILNEFLNQ